MRRTRAAGCMVGAVALLAIGLGVPAASQKVIERPLMENPHRTPGGSCIYGARGQLVFSPPGVTCPNHEVKGARGSEEPGNLTPAMAKSVRDLFATHPHIADEIVAVREAVEAGDRARALKTLDHVLGEVSANKAAAERVLDEMLRSQTAH